ncbi:tol-pal system YbgF family protein [Streptomyces buecherae]|uniref:tetratricopeptide repeat protein n=1 Tax=Streptomyces buecherae TaxID=2763006 RepID=UPI0036A02A84
MDDTPHATPEPGSPPVPPDVGEHDATADDATSDDTAPPDATADWGAPWPPPKPPRRRTYDPLAVALGNASLLGVGYLFLGRRPLALVQVAGVVALVAVSLGRAEPWCEFAVLGWWLLTTAHGWYLARRGDPRTTARGYRLVAAGLTLAVLLTVGLLRLDAAGIEDDVARARERGDCAAVLAAREQVGFGQRLADAPGAERGDAVVEVCRRLLSSGDELTDGLHGKVDTRKLTSGFDTLTDVLEQPEYTAAVAHTLDGFLRSLPLGSACDTVRVTDWLRARKTRHDVLDRVSATVRRTAPEALVDCADARHGREEWGQALGLYQRLLDRYPQNPLADRAREGVHKATLAVELATVRERLSDAYGGQPAYCSNPAKYSAAPAVRKGAVNRALFYGNDEYTDQLPKGWRASEASRAALIVCAGDTAATDSGTAVATCPYYSEDSPNLTGDVTFRKIAVPVKVYALRTGKVVAERTVEIGGTSCPSSFLNDTGLVGVPPDWLVTESADDVRAAFEPLIRRG